MLLLVSLVISVSTSIHTLEFEHHGSYFDKFCVDREQDVPNSHFCEPFFEYFKNMLKPYPGIPECEVCESIVKEFRTETEVKNVVENFVDSISTRFCESLDVAVRQNCKLWVPNHAGEIKTWLTNELKQGTLCQNLLNCKAKEDPTSFVHSFDIEKKDKSYPFCQICIKGVESIEKKFLRGLSFNDIVSKIDSFVCLNTPSRYYTNCNNFVHKMVEKFMKVVLRFQNSTKLCSDSSLCPTTSEIDFFEYFPEHFAFKEVTSETLCEVCNNITSEEFSHFTSEANVAEWKKIGYSVMCEDVTESETCHTFVDMIMNLVVAQFKHILTKEQMCHELLHCPTTPSPDFFYSIFSNYFHKSQDNKKDVDCLVCKAITHFFERTLRDPSTANLAKFIYRLVICGERREDLGKCIKTMEIDVPRIIDSMSRRLRHKSLCKKTCKNISDIMVPDSTCNFCKRVIKQVKGSVGFLRKNEKWIELKMNESCEKVRVLEMKECRELISDNRKNIKRFLMENYDSSRICKEINHCPNENIFGDFFHKDISYPHEFFDIDESYFHHFFEMFKSYPHKFFEMFSWFPYKFLEFYQSHPHYVFDEHKSYDSKFFDLYKSHPHNVYDVDKSYFSKFFDLYKSYDHKSSQSDEAYHFKFFDLFKSYPHKFFDFYKSYPYKFFEFFKSYPHHFSDFLKSYPQMYFDKSYAYKYFDMKNWNSHEKYPYTHFKKEDDSSKTECEACKKYTEELKRLHAVYVSDPKFWRVFVEGMCKGAEIGVDECRIELNRYFEVTFKIFDSGKSIETICKTSCKNFDNSIFMCVIEPKKYCQGNVIEHCGIYGGRFCGMFF